MVRPKDLLPACQGLSMEFFSFLIVALGMKHKRKGVE
jgi:hypothetical protein